jgi:predicted HTH domain antitoxin
MSLEISDEIIRSSGMSKEELTREIAVMLFQKERLTLAQAAKFAGMNRLQFQHLLASRQIPVHYDSMDFEDDIKTLHELGR